MFFEKAVFKNFAIFTGKHLRWSLLKSLCLEAFRAARLLKRDSKTGVFLNIVKFLRATILKNINERLLLNLMDLSQQLLLKKLFFKTAYMTYLVLIFISLLFHLICLFH